jgi:hypothetical protein
MMSKKLDELSEQAGDMELEMDAYQNRSKVLEN